MDLEIQGKIVHILEKQSGEGRNGPWQKQEFVIETHKEQYPKKICMNLWGDKTSALERLNVGDEIRAKFNIESREYNGRWYTDIKAWMIEPLEGENYNQDLPPEMPMADDLVLPEEGADTNDLPF